MINNNSVETIVDVVHTSFESDARNHVGKVDLDHLLDSQSLGANLVLVVVLCFFIVVIDGYDLLVTAQLLPAIAHDYGVTSATLTKSFAAQAFGQALGAFVLSPLADRFGRKPMLLVCLLLFGLATLRVYRLQQCLGIWSDSVCRRCARRHFAAEYNYSHCRRPDDFGACVCPFRYARVPSADFLRKPLYGRSHPRIEHRCTNALSNFHAPQCGWRQGRDQQVGKRRSPTGWRRRLSATCRSVNRDVCDGRTPISCLPLRPLAEPVCQEARCLKTLLGVRKPFIGVLPVSRSEMRITQSRCGYAKSNRSNRTTTSVAMVQGFQPD